MRKVLVLLTCLAVMGWSAAAFAEKPQVGKKGPAAIAFRDVKLKNGLRVIISEDHSAPVYAISLTYNVGSRNEVKGRTGFAHLFEHMMFQGSQNVGKGEHMLVVQENGGTMNGSTNADRTNYFESLPINQLDLGLFVESDRMRSLAITQGNLDNQRNAVQEERRLRVDNQPYGQTMEKTDELVFDNFAYKHSTIGSMDDLNAATLQDVQDFFKMYYAPNNAVMVLVGDFKTDDVLAKVKKYFDDIPAQPAPPVPDVTEPKQTAERRLELTDQFAQLPRLSIIYKTVKANTPDFFALDMAAEILGSGQSSRLFQKLVKEQQVALMANSGCRTTRGTATCQVGISPRPGKDLAQIEKTVYAEIDRLAKEGPADWEMQKVLLGMKHRRAQMLQASLQRANEIGIDTVYFNDPNLINTTVDKYAAVTKADIQRVLQTYLVVTNRSVVTTLPKPKSAPTAQAGQ